jgi:hypothetical protein
MEIEFVTMQATTVSSGLSPRFLRYVRHSSATRLACGSFVICSILAALAVGGGAMLWSGGSVLPGVLLIAVGGVIGLVGLLMAGLGWVSLQAELKLFNDGPLTPGVLVSTGPNVVVGLTDLRGAFPGVAYALTQITPRFTGLDAPAPGTRIPCFSDSQQQIKSDRFNMVNIYLIPWGTGEPAEIRQCLEKLGEEPFGKLEAVLARGIVPSGDMNKVLLDEDLEVVGSQANG